MVQAAILNHGDKVDDKAVRAVVEETSALVSDVDLMITAQSLNLCCALLEVRPACAQTMAQRILPQAMLLVKSPLLQVSCLPGRFWFDSHCQDWESTWSVQKTFAIKREVWMGPGRAFENWNLAVCCCMEERLPLRQL